MISRAQRLGGCLIGTAVGDSLLLPMEGLSRSAIARRFQGALRQRFFVGRGMVSDDTEHALLTARAWLAVGADSGDARSPERFARALARRLRWWLCSLPPGCGLATARGLIRSWCGWPPSRSGVRSAGNGPSMRSAIIGAVADADPVLRRSLVEASTAITHRDAIALAAAQAVAATAALLMRGGVTDADVFAAWSGASDEPAWQRAVASMRRVADGGGTVDDLARELGCLQRVTGWSLQSVPVALYAWWRHRGDAAACLTAIRDAGGDTDSTGAIAGALIGLDRGEAAFPEDWRGRIIGWPMTLAVLRSTGAALAGTAPLPGWCWPAQPLRNLAMLVIVIGHGLRRLVPGSGSGSGRGLSI